MNLLRGIFTSCAEGVFKLCGLSGRYGETVENAELLQQYGFTSRPKAGAEAVLVVKGNMAFVLATDDRNYRIAVESGEVAIYTDEGDKLHFKRDREVELVAGIKLSITAPDTELSGNLTVAGQVSDSAGTMAAMRTAYNAHTHTDPQGGVSGAPSAAM